MAIVPHPRKKSKGKGKQYESKNWYSKKKKT